MFTFHLKQWFCTEDDFGPQEHLAMSGDSFDCHNSEAGVWATVIWWIEAKDGIIHPTMLGQASHNKHYLAHMSVVQGWRTYFQGNFLKHLKWEEKMGNFFPELQFAYEHWCPPSTWAPQFFPLHTICTFSGQNNLARRVEESVLPLFKIVFYSSTTRLLITGCGEARARDTC